MVKKILLVDYYGTCDSKGNPIGHSPKVLREYRELIQENFVVGAALSPCMLKGAEVLFADVISLKYNINAEGHKSLWERIGDKFKLLYNIKQVLKHDEYDIMWFYRTDFFLFFSFYFNRRKYKTKLIGQVYQEEFVGGMLDKLLNYIYKKGAMRFDGLIYTQKGMAGFHPNTLYIPDYYYDEEKYGKYRKRIKEEKAVCVGTMNTYKKLEKSVEAFNQNGMKLEIKGYFYNKERLKKLLEQKKDNVEIKDEILSEEEYYSLLAGAKYSLLPYDMEQYSSRTSGVLQESLFLGAIPIAPIQLLEENNISGIGYERIEELAGLNWMQKKVQKDDGNWLKEYSKKSIRNRLLVFLEA